MWAVSTVTMLVLAGVLPDFQLESSNGDSATRIAVTAGVGAAVFGLLSSLVWPCSYGHCSWCPPSCSVCSSSS